MRTEYQANLEKLIIDNETIDGKFEERVYPDSKEVPTIGYGLNLKDETAKARVEKYGYSYEELLAGTASMSEADGKQIMREQIEESVSGARRLFSNYDELDEGRRATLVDMIYNMGESKVKNFTKTRNAVESEDWGSAAKEVLWNTQKDGSLTPTGYSNDVPKRAKRSSESLLGNSMADAPFAQEPELAPAGPLETADIIAAGMEDAATAFPLPGMGDVQSAAELTPMQSMQDPIDTQIPESVASTEAFYTATLSGTDDAIAQYDEIKTDLQETGNSPVVATTRQRLADELNIVQNDELFATIMAHPEMTSAAKTALIQEHTAREINIYNVDMQAESMIELGASQNHANPQRQETHDGIMDGVGDILDVRDDIITQMDMLGATLQGVDDLDGMTSAVVNFFATAVPFNVGNTYRKIVNDVLPEKAKAYNWLVPGEALVALKDELHALPPEQQQDFAKAILKSIGENSGYLGSNDFIKYMVMHSVFDDFLNPENRFEFDTDRFIENVSGPLDALFAGQMLKGGFKILKQMARTSPAATISHVAKEDAAALLAEGLISPDVAKALGVTPEEIMSHAVLPKPIGYTSHMALPSDIAERVAMIQRNLDEVEGLSVFPTINLTAEEIAQAPSAWKGVLENREGAKVYNGMLEVGKDGEHMVAKGMYGMDKLFGFPSGIQAANKAKELFGDAPYTIMKKQGENIVKPKSLSGRGEYFIQFETRREFNSMDALLFENAVHIGGAKAKYVADPSARFSKEVSDAGLRAHDLGKGIAAKLTNMLRPFQGLPVEGRLKVIDVVQEGAKAEKAWTHAELLTKGLKANEIVGYYGWKATNDALYLLNNQRYHGKLVADQFQYLQNSKGGAKILAKANPIDYNVKQALDPSTGKIMPLKAADIDVLYEEGSSIMRLQKTKFDGANGTDFVIMSKTQGSKLGSIPEKVLNYKPGYVTRYYKDMYFIDEIKMVTIDGKLQPHTRAVHTAGSISDAQRLADDFNLNRTAGEAELTYKPRRGTEHSTEERANKLFQVEEARGRTFFSQRGEQLQGIEGLAEIQDPVDSLLRALNTTARSVSHEPFVNSMKQRWMNTYSDLLKPGSRGFPVKFELKEGGLGQSKRVGEARALHDNISLMSGVPDSFAQAWKGWAMNLAEKLDTAGFAKTGKLVAKAGDRDPTVRLKGLTFNLFLGANPIRQFGLQTQQFLFVAPLAPKYALTRLMPHKLGIDIGMVAGMGKFGKGIAENADLMKLGAKTAGMEISEFKHMVQAFKDSGIPYSIDSNVFARDSINVLSQDLSKSAARRGLTHLSSIPSRAMHAVKRIGFDFGEYNNLTLTYLIARQRHLSKTGKSWTKLTKNDMDSIAADSRQLSLSMTEAGSLGYQKGWASLATQFLSIQHKALAAALPGKWGGNRAFTGSEKFRIFGGQLVFYGASGLGINEAYKAARDKFGVTPDKEVDIAVQGGIADFMLNKIFGSDDIQVADSFAPVSGVLDTTKGILKGAINMNVSWPDAMMGASWKATSRIWKALDGVGAILSAPRLDNKDTLRLAVNEGMQVFSGYNNFVKSRVAMQLGYHVDNSGDPIIEATYAEAMAQLGGYQSKAVKDHYGLNEAHMKATGRELGAASPYKSVARTYYDRLTRIVTLDPYLPQGTTLDDVYFKRLAEAARIESLVLSVLDDQERDLVLQEFRAMVNKGVEVGSDKLIDTIAKSALGGKYGTDVESMITELQNSNLIKTPEQAKGIQDMYDYLTKEQ